MAEFVTDVFLVTARDSDFSTFILETTTRQHDGNLWEVSWRHKAKRFVGFKRNPDDEYVVTDITVISEDKDVPDDYAGLLITKDTKEKGLRKQIICYKRDSRKAAKQAITEVNVINPSKGELVPAQFTGISTTVNELMIVFKLRDLPNQTPIPPPKVSPVQHQQLQTAGVPQSPISGIEGVPFQINSKYDTKALQNDPVLGGITQVSLDELAQKYSYSFRIEKNVVDGT